MLKKFFLVFFAVLLILLPVLSFAGNVTLAWDAVTTNIDGTPCTDLGGYKIYYGTAPQTYTHVIDVGNVTQYTITLSQGTYYFAVTAYNTAGAESEFSNEISTVVPGTVPSAPSNLTGTVTGVQVK